MNGVVEALIHSVRKALDASEINYTHSQLTYEPGSTVLSEISSTAALFSQMGIQKNLTASLETVCCIHMVNLQLYKHP